MATRTLEAGELLMALPPIAFLASAPGQPRPSGEALVDHVLAHQLHLHPWARVLFDGSLRSTQVGVVQECGSATRSAAELEVESVWEGGGQEECAAGGLPLGLWAQRATKC